MKNIRGLVELCMKLNRRIVSFQHSTKVVSEELHLYIHKQQILKIGIVVGL